MKQLCPNRLDYLDNIKWFLAIIVIFHHSLDKSKLLYLQYYTSFNDITAFNQSFFMDLFFFISAYFLIPSILKKGRYAFNKDKIIRLGGAVLIGSLIVNYVSSKLEFGSRFSSSSFWSYYYTHFTNLQWHDLMGVTWFCWALLIFTLIWSLLIKNSNIQNKNDEPLPSFFKIIAFCLIMLPINYFAIELNHKVDGSDLGFFSIKWFPTYIASFIFGIKSYQNNWLEKINLKYAIFGLILCLFFFDGTITHFLLGLTFVGDDSYDFFRTPCAIGMILFLLYIFKRFFNHSNRVTKVLACASFPAYVVQFIFLNSLFKSIPPAVSWNPWVITLVIGVISVICSFTIGIILYRLPFFKRIF